MTLHRIEPLNFLKHFKSIPSSYILYSIIINLGKAEDLVVDIHAYLRPPVSLLRCLFANSK